MYTTSLSYHLKKIGINEQGLPTPRSWYIVFHFTKFREEAIVHGPVCQVTGVLFEAVGQSIRPCSGVKSDNISVRKRPMKA